MLADHLAPRPELSDLDKVRSIRRYRQLELIGEIGNWNKVAHDMAKGWARQLGINWVFDPKDFNPREILSHIERTTR